MLLQTLLIVDADALIRSSLRTYFENQNYKVCEAGTIDEAVRNDLSAVSAIVCDDQLIEIIKLATGTPVIVTSAQASLRSAVEAMKFGATDYLAKPFDLDELASIIEALTSHHNVQLPLDILGECDNVQALNEQLNRVGPTDTTVLITGESGTGKELVARKIHALSNRANRKMISLNCAAIPSELIESELFGQETYASFVPEGRTTGLVEAADGSTLFLDEIGELSMDAQARLLRVIQDGELRPIGSADSRKISIRLIASTHRNLQSMSEQGSFREDLYFRLNVVKFSLTPLRERADDIILLAKHFLASTAKRYSKKKLRFSEAAITCMMDYRWPGNVRELENAIQRAVILCDRKTISTDLLALEQLRQVEIPSNENDESGVSLENYFKNFVLDNEDKMTETEIAEKLGISRKALWQRRQKLGIPRKRGKRF